MHSVTKLTLPSDSSDVLGVNCHCFYVLFNGAFVSNLKYHRMKGYK
jgi:hypothetical protein